MKATAKTTQRPFAACSTVQKLERLIEAYPELAEQFASVWTDRTRPLAKRPRSSRKGRTEALSA